jgi:site-specific DNA-cytosine methylase
MTKLKVLDLFAGIAGMSLGLHRTGGFETVRFCEIKPHARAVIEKNFGPVPIDEARRIDMEEAAALEEALIEEHQNETKRLRARLVALDAKITAFDARMAGETLAEGRR